MNANLCNEAQELIGNPNVLVNIISARVRQLNTGGARPLIDSPLLGAADLALTELVEGKMDYELTDPIAVEIQTARNVVKGKKKANI
jgi:DNA-directed RNA polymerase subunit omega